MRPVTQAQWQDAVDMAEILARTTTAQVLLFIEMGRIFNLVDENGIVDVQACYEIVEDARSQGIMPSEKALRLFIAGVEGEE